MPPHACLACSRFDGRRARRRLRGAGIQPAVPQIKALLVKSLNSGEWKPGELIPSEQELASRFGVSQGTVRKAIDEMAMENLLTRRQGRAPSWPPMPSRTSSTASCGWRRTRGLPAAWRGTSWTAGACGPPPRWPGRWSSPGDSVLQIHRTLSRMGRPVVLDEIWLPATPFKGLTADRLAQYAGPMYGLFETEFGVRMIRAEEKIRAVAADARTAEILQVAVGAAAQRGAAVAHLSRQARRTAARLVRHQHPLLQERTQLKSSDVRRASGKAPESLVRCNKIIRFR
jgi:GntR family transcriptional regulator